ncbi:MAG: 4Fe-4S dicluster domain-containing protein [Dehalococcoidia bacterium]|nr:MAG: 4Fe-4S dicluster domain-containing protein [Dehalococcoidia bacterium]
MAKAILYDATKCTACRACQVACKNWNEREAVDTINRGTYENPLDLSTQTWLKMEFREIGDNGTFRWLFTRRACMHCTDAGCVKVCPTGALYHHDEGFVAYDKAKCSGCGYCVEFCPYSVPRMDTNRASGLGRMDKCTFCATPGLDRIDAGEEPACVKTCPTGALTFGDRATLLAAAKAKVEDLKAQGHSNAQVYGENEVSGLHVLYLLDDSPETYGLVVNPKVPAAAAAHDIIKPLGYAVAGVVALGLLLNIMVARARIISREEEKEDARG